jgi:hypothetical protein
MNSTESSPFVKKILALNGRPGSVLHLHGSGQFQGTSEIWHNIAIAEYLMPKFHITCMIDII